MSSLAEKEKDTLYDERRQRGLAASSALGSGAFRDFEKACELLELGSGSPFRRRSSARISHCDLFRKKRCSQLTVGADVAKFTKRVTLAREAASRQEDAQKKYRQKNAQHSRVPASRGPFGKG